LSGYKTQTNFLKYSEVTGKERAKRISTPKKTKPRYLNDNKVL